MPKAKSHKGLLKRIKITKTGKVRFGRPGSRHLKSNKSGEQIRGYRKRSYARSGDMKRLEMLLHRPLRSQEQSMADRAAKETADAAVAEGT
jgi:large subunit ribosomal protein L35